MVIKRQLEYPPTDEEYAYAELVLVDLYADQLSTDDLHSPALRSQRTLS